MTDAYVPQVVRKSGWLARGQKIEVAFELAHPGQIGVGGGAYHFEAIEDGDDGLLRRWPWRVVAPSHFRLTLIDPLGASVVAADDDSSWHNIQTGELGTWTARVTCEDSRRSNCSVSTLHPTNIFRHEVPVEAVNQRLTAFLVPCRVRIDRGSVTLTFNSADPPLAFDITSPLPDLVVPVQLGLTVRLYPSDINSISVQGEIGGGPSVTLLIYFEQDGEEIHGDFHGEVFNMKLKGTVAMNAADGRVTVLFATDTEFSFDDIDTVGIPDTLIEPLFNYMEILKSVVTGTFRTFLNNSETRVAIGTVVQAVLISTLPAGARIQNFEVAEGVVTILYTVH